MLLVLTRMEATTMASNATTYTNLTPAKSLSKATLNKMVWRSLNLQGSFNYERMQAAGWLYSILPGLLEIHGEGTEDLKISMGHNLEFFNTHPFLVTFVMGIILSLEQQKADIATIRAVRVAAMGPLGGIGDAIFWFTLVPIAAGICSNMAIEGNIMGPIMFLLIFNFLTVLRSEFWGQVLHYTLTIVSAPMICSGHWALSLFLWACLLVASLQQLRKDKR